VLAAAGLGEADLADPDRLLELEPVLRLVQAAAEAVGDACLGLHLGESWDLGGLGVLSHAVLNAPTVGTGLRNLDRYGRSHVQGGRIALQLSAGEARLHYDLEVSDRELARQHLESAAVVGVRIVQRLAGAEWRPRRVVFGHRRPSDVSEHARIFGCPVRFGGDEHLVIAFDAADLEHSVAGADRRLLPIVEQHLDKLLAADVKAALVQEVRGVLAQVLCDGNPSICMVAKLLGMSVRTLQRRLDDHGVAFRDLVQDIRCELAQRYLADRGASLTEVAFLLGYSELSTFDRAFRRWTGSTPVAARRSLRAATATRAESSTRLEQRPESIPRRATEPPAHQRAQRAAR
jgi:AraC-like DNA-binding protein